MTKRSCGALRLAAVKPIHPVAVRLAGSLLMLAGLTVPLGACSDDDLAPGSDAGVADGRDGAGAGEPGDASREEPEMVREMLQIDVGKWTFDATVAGPEDGELVMLLHGFPQTGFQWRFQQQSLAEAGYRAVAPNQRGYSPGARPAEVEQYEIPRLVADVIGMVDALGQEEFHVVGHDWGGAIAWSVALLFPDRVKSLAVLSTPHPDAFSAALADTDSCQYQASRYFDALSSPEATVADLAMIEGAGFEQLPPESLTHYSENVLTQPAVFQAALNWYRANVSNRMIGGGVELGPAKLPTLYMWGTDDVTFCRETAEATADYVDGPYTFVPVEGAGHWLSELNPDEVNAALLTHLSR